jgi:hypothetical protein
MPFTDAELQSLAARLNRLESQNRNWKLATVLLAACSAPLFLMAAKAADDIDPKVIHARTVEAQDFVVKDAAGQIRARLTLNPQVKLQRQAYSPEINVNAPLGPALQFYDGQGEVIWTEPRNPSMIPAR